MIWATGFRNLVTIYIKKAKDYMILCAKCESLSYRLATNTWVVIVTSEEY